MMPMPDLFREVDSAAPTHVGGTRILALDPATATGVADGIGGAREAPWLATWNLREERGSDGPEEIFCRAARLLQLRIALERPGVLAIEMPVPPHRTIGTTQYATTLITVGLYALFVGIAGAARIKVLPVHNKTWRKAVLGSGNLDRASAKRAATRVCTMQKWAPANDDEAEAACIWMWACGQTQADLLVRRAHG
jgi:hypothetical protein